MGHTRVLLVPLSVGIPDKVTKSTRSTAVLSQFHDLVAGHGLCLPEGARMTGSLN